MKILIHDASVLIDLLKVELLNAALSLPHAMQTTDLVRDEVLDPGQRSILLNCIAIGKILVVKSNAEQMVAIFQMNAQNPRLSIQDCSIIYHAKAGGQVVIAGDGLLRKQARFHGLEVHGTLWVFDQMVKHTQVSASIAVEKLCKLIALNPRLPKAECERMIGVWNKTIE